MDSLTFGPLVQTAWLANHLGDADLCVFDTTVFLRPDPDGPRPYRIESGREAYELEHVTGAAFLDLPGDLSDRSSRFGFQMPGVEQLERVLSAAGLGEGRRVVLYSAGSVMWSTRMWWMLRSAGFDEAAVLDGGWEKWRREGRPTAAGSEAYSAARFEARMRSGLLIGKEEMVERSGRDSVCTLNALSPGVYAGTSSMSYGRPGHIPGSHNVYYNTLLDPDSGTFLPTEQLERLFVSSGALESEQVVAYCGGGISATMDALALVLIGRPDVAVYDGSMSEWAADESLPLETGSEPA